ncbi:hypothetical protein NOI24_29245 [Neorhizobium galegae]|uniref:hypothetical protein n=1 Tax=Neorhizobium galegae TaxID=399 RepID=UPI00210266B1|nr:hypothetical protein [Neorhizobium galegae]MCQ1775347.1 hypothetical protein [Neorhizobium galegae]MCQ1799893.1 hypothetical protein [Neorhizobium galegae]
MSLVEVALGQLVKVAIDLLSNDLLNSRKRLGRQFYALYVALEDCQEAYRRSYCRDAKDDEEFFQIASAEYKQSLKILGDRYLKVRRALRIYAKDVHNEIPTYLKMPHSSPIEIVRKMQKDDSNEEDYQKITANLEKFIRENFKVDEIF